MTRARGIAAASLFALTLAHLAGQSGRVLEFGGTSPRIERLQSDLARGVPGAVDQFWVEMSRQHTPILEPIPGTPGRVRVTLVWRGSADTRSVESMTRVPGTNVWFQTFTMPRDHRFWYRVTPTVDRVSAEPPTPQPDPLNPHRFIPPVAQERPPSAIKHDSPFMRGSIVVLPDAPASPWVDPLPGVPAGRVEERAYPSQVYGEGRRVWIYTPPARGTNAPAPAGLLVCLWGLDYLNEIPVPTILDNLIAQGRIPSIAAVFVDNTGDRFQDFQSAEKFAQTFGAELIPWARRTLHVPADPRRLIVTGYSAAGLESGYLAFRHPELIGNVLSQSGAFWRQFEGEGGSEPEWLAAQYARVDKRETRFFIDVGGAETSAAAGQFKAANIRLRDVLLNKGYTVKYKEVPGGEHEFIHWRTTIAEGLLFVTSDWPR